MPLAWMLYLSQKESEALSVGVHPDAPPLPERGLHVLLPDALDAEVGELHRHVLTVDVLFAHAHLAATLSHTCRADQVVGMGPGTGVIVVGHTAYHHHGGALVVTNLDSGIRFPLSCGFLSLERPRPAALALIPKSRIKLFSLNTLLILVLMDSHLSALDLGC